MTLTPEPNRELGSSLAPLDILSLSVSIARVDAKVVSVVALASEVNDRLTAMELREAEASGKSRAWAALSGRIWAIIIALLSGGGIGGIFGYLAGANLPPS